MSTFMGKEVNVEVEKIIIMAKVKKELNNCELNILKYNDEGKQIDVTVYVIEDDEEIRLVLNRRKDGYRIVGMV